jgi:hypothetical protein
MKIIISESAYDWVIETLESTLIELPNDVHSNTWYQRYNEAFKKNAKTTKFIENLKAQKEELEEKRRLKEEKK